MVELGRDKQSAKTGYIISPNWAAWFFLVGGMLLLVIGVLVRLLLGLSAASDQVFAIEALISGAATDLLFRHFKKLRLLIAPKVGVPFIYLWSLLCLYVFIARPFE